MDRSSIEHDLAIYNPVIVMAPGAQQLEIAELVDHSGPEARRSGRFVHLKTTLVDAMQLLALLKEAQRRLGLPDYPDSATMIPVPPAKDRN
jgi:hypothetical protein